MSRNQSHFSEARQRRPPQIADGTNIFTRNLTLDRFVGPGVRNNSIKVLGRSGVLRAFSQTTSRKPTTHVSSRGRGVFTLSSGQDIPARSTEEAVGRSVSRQLVIYVIRVCGRRGTAHRRRVRHQRSDESGGGGGGMVKTVGCCKLYWPPPLPRVSYAHLSKGEGRRA